MRKVSRAFVAIGLFVDCGLSLAQANHYILYVGTYTSGESKGIYEYGYDAASGKLTSLGLAAEAVNPSFLAVDAGYKFLYAVNEIREYKGEASGGVTPFGIYRKTGKLAQLDEVASRGADPCYISFDRTGEF